MSGPVEHRDYPPRRRLRVRLLLMALDLLLTLTCVFLVYFVGEMIFGWIL